MPRPNKHRASAQGVAMEKELDSESDSTIEVDMEDTLSDGIAWFSVKLSVQMSRPSLIRWTSDLAIWE